MVSGQDWRSCVQKHCNILGATNLLWIFLFYRNRKKSNEFSMRNYNHLFGTETFPKAEFCIKTDVILLDKFPAKILCSKWAEIECFKLSQRKIFALSMTSAMLCFLLHLNEFNKNPNIRDFLMELLLLLSLCHLSWAEKSNALNINFYKYLFWQELI